MSDDEQWVAVCVHPEFPPKVYGAWDTEDEGNQWLEDEHLTMGYGENDWSCKDGVEILDHFVVTVVAAG